MVTLSELREANGLPFGEKMNEGGITDERLIKKIDTLLDATETKPFNDKGSIVYAKPLNANDIQLRTTQLACQLKGLLINKQQVSVDDNSPRLPLTEEQELELESIKELKRRELKRKAETL